jgi:indolepyruvate ferredoxin oxidoreductase
VSGYRGSPLGGLDENLWKAKGHLEAHHVQFVPGVNEDLAATAVWGTQTVDLIGPAKYDGVFAMWYGKGPGVDRCGDVFKHMNHAGTAKHGGVLLVAGDDHGAYSSTLPHQSDHIFAACMIPVLYPCNVQEYLDLGVHGWAMSRFSGLAVAFKALADTVESSASVDADPFRVEVKIPQDFAMPEGGLNTRLSSVPLGQQARNQEALMQDYKIYAALAYARENKLNRTTIDSPNAKLGIIASGKSYLDVLEALEELGIDEAMAAQVGLRLFKVAMIWPLEPEGVREFAQGLDEILVVEEKRQVVEYQLKEQLYNWRDDVRPHVVGKFDDKGEWVAPRGEWLLPPKADFSVAQVARVIAGRIAAPEPGRRHARPDQGAPGLPGSQGRGADEGRHHAVPPGLLLLRLPAQHLDQGAGRLVRAGRHRLPRDGHLDLPGDEQADHPHGRRRHAVDRPGRVLESAARVPEPGRRHLLPLRLPGDPRGGRGQGQHHLQDPVQRRGRDDRRPAGRRHHLGAADRPADGGRRRETHRARHRRPVALRRPFALPESSPCTTASTWTTVQRELRELPGVTVLIYDQTCAAEKRRRRKKGEFPDPNKRMVINEAVCEGCGDCGVQSNCVAILPKETEFGRKRAIDQSSCNKDYSCTKGFCPSFVTVEGGTLKKNKAGVAKEGGRRLGPLPAPVLPSIAHRRTTS